MDFSILLYIMLTILSKTMLLKCFTIYLYDTFIQKHSIHHYWYRKTTYGRENIARQMVSTTIIIIIHNILKALRFPL